ncbi:hypothetical protein O181_064573 [Austropuccinia psidii MF-1]|uniref:Uncharacterized protein n=1 Tax=Austropuccinia psidii MF-1 TaxID=1389203 RepID=A0A9Q3I1R7_9BASI|nr:hypothetical protein [Austropuccinia psidii MF-1]
MMRPKGMYGYITLFISGAFLAASCQAGLICNIEGCKRSGKSVQWVDGSYKAECGHTLAPADTTSFRSEAVPTFCESCNQIKLFSLIPKDTKQLVRCKLHLQAGPTSAEQVTAEVGEGSRSQNNNLVPAAYIEVSSDTDPGSPAAHQEEVSPAQLDLELTLRGPW